jgi:hypothetical protein
LRGHNGLIFWIRLTITSRQCISTEGSPQSPPQILSSMGRFMVLSKFFYLYSKDKISRTEMILQLFYYWAAQSLICLHIIKLNSKASSFSNISCHFYTMLNTARNLNIMTTLPTCDAKLVHSVAWYSDNHSYRLVQLILLTSEKHISRYTRFLSVIKVFTVHVDHVIGSVVRYCSYSWFPSVLVSTWTYLSLPHCVSRLKWQLTLND